MHLNDFSVEWQIYEVNSSIFIVKHYSSSYFVVCQLIPCLELSLTHLAVVKIFRICRMNLFVNSQDSFRLQFHAADITFEFPLEGVNVTDVRI